MEAARLKAKVDGYDAQSGGTWNYDSLYSTCISYLKGIPREQAENFLASHEGPGEAKAKLSIFNALCKSVPFDYAQHVEDGRKTVSFGDRKATIAPDFSYKTDKGIFCVFVYPYKQPALKQNQRMAIVSTLASPPHTEPHFLQLVEYSEVSGQRRVALRLKRSNFHTEVWTRTSYCTCLVFTKFSIISRAQVTSSADGVELCFPVSMPVC